MGKRYDAMLSRFLYAVHSRPVLKWAWQVLYLIGMFVSVLFRTFVNPTAQVRMAERLTEPLARLSDRLLEPVFRFMDPLARASEGVVAWLAVKTSFVWQPLLQLVGLGIKRLTTLF